MIDVEKFLRLTQFRKDMVDAAPWTVTERRAYTKALLLNEQEETSRIAGDQFGQTLALQGFKLDLTKESGFTPSPPHLTGNYVATLGWERFEAIYDALTGLDPKNIDEDILRINMAKFDSTMGIVSAGGVVSLAVSELRKGADKAATDGVDLFQRVTGSTVLIGQAYMYLNLRRFAKDFSIILSKDPTGFALMDYVSPTKKKEPSIIFPTPPHMVRDFVAIGAQEAVKRFKILSPWA